MNTEAFMDVTAIIMLPLSLGIFVLSRRISSRKPLLLHTRVHLVVMVLLFLLPTTALFVGVWPPDWPSLLSALIVLAVVISLLLFGFRRSMGDVILYNVTETMLRQALAKALDEHNLAHAEGERPGLLVRTYAKLNAEIKFSLALPDLNSAIHVTVNPLGTARLRFAGKRAIPDYQGLIASLNERLQAQEFDGSRFYGRFMPVVALLLLGLSLWFLLT